MRHVICISVVILHFLCPLSNMCLHSAIRERRRPRQLRKTQWERQEKQFYV
jgi:hypothetical protein